MGDYQRFVVAEIAISQPEHQTIPEAIHAYGSTRLWDAIARGRAELVESSHG
jgi:hypothetical protein